MIKWGDLMYIPVEFGKSLELSEVDVEAKTFKELGLKEKDIEEFLRRNISLIFSEEETLLVVGQQVRTGSQGISDLTAIDGEGNIVLIEIKRDAEDIQARKEAFEFQAIRYAASYAKLKDTEEIVDSTYTSYIEKHPGEYDLGGLTPQEKARRELQQFLESNNAARTFNSKQRIILIASTFDKQTLSAVAWLIANNVDISCFTITPVLVGKQGFLNIDRILPPPQIEDFYTGLAGRPVAPKAETASKNAITRTFLPRMNKLFEWGVIKRRDQLKVRNFDDSLAEVVDEKNVKFNDRTMSYNNWGQEVTGWSTINIYEWAILISQNKTLHELRAARMEEMEKARNENSSIE